MLFKYLEQFLLISHIDLSHARHASPLGIMVRLRGKNSEAIRAATEKSNANLVVPEDEQWRLIRESGVLQNIGTTQPKVSSEDGPEPDEEMFNAVLLVIPFSFILLMMDMYVSSP